MHVTVQRRYNALKYNKILHTSLQKLRLNINQSIKIKVLLKTEKITIDSTACSKYGYLRKMYISVQCCYNAPQYNTI